ncbi:MAG: mannose-1-phosphate guanyltransferase [Heterodermia speciosa]|uniref:Mannose-1-phosphate guanyltransferase n=1 Tax=Heterodermia speciosa TaxID=116794 RepID=A0A8H3FUH1_9LECA|nr:MAG: mannose-1-phosphate guanyltransferase [Heterodermia speciosa]
MSTAAYTPKTQENTIVAQRPPSPHIKNPDHFANTGIDEDSTYVLTLQTNREFHERINDLRRQYFPAQLNKIDAHITLFHALPGSRLGFILSDLLEIARTEQRFRIQTIKPLQWTHGVALDANNHCAHRLWKLLERKWGSAGADFLSKQDRGGFKAHYTIQNKVEKEVAKQTWEEVRDRFESDEGEVLGFTLYKYAKSGHWIYQQAFDFAESLGPTMSSVDFPSLGNPT